jgi:TM2 domain-containing membrane protein YozV
VGQKSQRTSAQKIAVKRTSITYLLWLLGGFGVLGLHRLYLGRWVSGLIWLFTGGLFLVGAIIDLFLIPEMVRVENLSQILLAESRRHLPRTTSSALS